MLVGSPCVWHIEGFLCAVDMCNQSHRLCVCVCRRACVCAYMRVYVCAYCVCMCFGVCMCLCAHAGEHMLAYIYDVCMCLWVKQNSGCDANYSK